MAISKQHENFDYQLEIILKETPKYEVKYVDAKQDIRLFNYVKDFRTSLLGG